MNVEVMLYKPYDLAGACEKFVIVVTHENRDAAQMSPLQCEKIDDHAKERESARATRRSGLVTFCHPNPVSGTQLLPAQCEATLSYGR